MSDRNDGSSKRALPGNSASSSSITTGGGKGNGKRDIDGNGE